MIVAAAGVATTIAVVGNDDGDARGPIYVDHEPIYVDHGGYLFDESLVPVGRLRVRGRLTMQALSVDGRIAFSTDREATRNEDCCGPDRTVIYVVDDGGGRVG